jgi:hypothetical protein
MPWRIRRIENKADALVRGPCITYALVVGSGRLLSVSESLRSAATAASCLILQASTAMYKSSLICRMS